MAEGKEHALAIGITTLSTEDMYDNNFFKDLFYYRSYFVSELK